MVNNWRLNHDPEELRIGCFGELKWIELLHGRLPDSLAWYQLELATRSIQGKGPSDPNQGELFAYGSIFGILILRADLPTIKRLERLPDALENLGLGKPARRCCGPSGGKISQQKGSLPKRKKWRCF